MPRVPFFEAPLRALRRLRWKAGRWSKASDQQYHDELYRAPVHDAFSVDYPGYVTIRRFADHAESLLPAEGTVLDAGCGPGEITCELARRHPHLQFFGIDHSAQAIVRARQNADRLALDNIRFEAGDAESIAATGTFGLVTMFDAFHHLEAPERFLTWIGARTTRCLLIEPAGTWAGGWSRDLDADWLLTDLANVRERLEALVGPGAESRMAEVPADGEGPPRGQGAVERRYAAADFQKFFKGWQLRITGTIAGFDNYPALPYARGPLRRVFGEAAYEAVRAAEDLLIANGGDGSARHWVVAATTEDGLVEPRMPVRNEVAAVPSSSVRGAFDVRYDGFEGPDALVHGTELRAVVTFLNNGWDTWRSEGEHPVHVSYHWLAQDGVTVVAFNGERSLLPHPVAPGERCRAMLLVRVPNSPGRYVLAIDLVQEGVRWFSEAGAPWLAVAVTIT